MREDTKDALLVVGLGVATTLGLGYLFARLQPRLLQLDHPRGNGGNGLQPDVRPPPDQRPPPVAVPEQLTGTQIPLEAGVRYLASVKIRFPLSLAANPSKARDQAQKMGFRDVIVTTGGRPAGWPPVAAGDYYVEGTYAGSPQTLARSHAGGQAEVVDAWRVGMVVSSV